ncbi:hypothetical protein HK105_204485 [Polyrhizophydium stewartii]|uniref:Uncharacterized protein n=1 Tax=Polyrhizophydium stewartii TaxID=2732419 RepID=A0ABR4N947_9FUNG
MRSKLYDRAVASPHELAPGEQPVLPPPEFTPFECVLKHQAYQECKINLMNPRKRFRTPYGGAPPKDSGSAVFNDVLGKDAPNERPETA